MSSDSLTDWLSSMSPPQVWIVSALLLLVLGRLVQASSSHRLEALFNVGAPAVLAAAAGGLRLLLDLSDLLREAGAAGGKLFASDGHANAVAVRSLGDDLLADAIYVYVVFILVIAMIFIEHQWAAKAREARGFKVKELAHNIGVGYLIPAFVGGFALYLMYTAA